MRRISQKVPISTLLVLLLFFSANYPILEYLNPCFLTTSVKNKYLEVLFGKYGEYKSKYTLKPILCQNMVHFN